MSKEEKVKEALSKQDLFKFLSIERVNHKPHPYTVGPKHITHANRNGGLGILDEQVCREVQCAHPECNTPYDEHTSDEVCFLQLLRDGTEKEANTILKQLVGDLGEAFVDGFSFVETDEKFRIT